MEVAADLGAVRAEALHAVVAVLERVDAQVGRNDDARKMFKAIAQSSNPHWRAQGQTLLDGLAQ